MKTSPVHLRVFLFSPGDVGEERRQAREVVECLPREHAWLEAYLRRRLDAGKPSAPRMSKRTTILSHPQIDRYRTHLAAEHENVSLAGFETRVRVPFGSRICTCR